MESSCPVVHALLSRYYPGSSELAWEDLNEVYLPADEAGELRMRVHCVLPLTTRGG